MKIIQIDFSEVKNIFKMMNPVKGEVRCVYRCRECGNLFGRRFIPYGLGQGLTVKACLCQLTGRPGFDLIEQKPKRR